MREFEITLFYFFATLLLPQCSPAVAPMQSRYCSYSMAGDQRRNNEGRAKEERGCLGGSIELQKWQIEIITLKRQGGSCLFYIQHPSEIEIFKSECPLCLFGGAKLQNNLDVDMSTCLFLIFLSGRGGCRLGGCSAGGMIILSVGGGRLQIRILAEVRTVMDCRLATAGGFPVADTSRYCRLAVPRPCPELTQYDSCDQWASPFHCCAFRL